MKGGLGWEKGLADAAYGGGDRPNLGALTLGVTLGFDSKGDIIGGALTLRTIKGGKLEELAVIH